MCDGKQPLVICPFSRYVKVMDLQRLEPFLRTLRQQRTVFWIASIVLLLFAGLLVFIPVNPKEGAKDWWIKLGMIGFFLSFGLWLLYQAWRPIEQNPALRLFLDRSTDIVWICPVRVLRNGYHVNTRFSLNTIHGKRLGLAVMAMDEKAAEEVLRQAMPHVRFGFSPEWEKAFKRDPNLLRQG